jgi:hypothetical protein
VEMFYLKSQIVRSRLAGRCHLVRTLSAIPKSGPGERIRTLTRCLQIRI